MSGSSNPFDMSKMAMGGFGQMLDNVEFVKRAWSTLNIPGNLVPTVDVEELDKRIADLKAVEQWLNLNLSMLRGTIQGLEIQRGTLAAVKAFGASMGGMGMGLGGAPDSAPPAWPRTAAAPTATAPAPERAAAERAASASRPSAAAAAPDAGAAAGRSVPGEDTAPSGPPPQMPGMPGINPGVWWNLLQQNFNQVAEAALSGVGLQGAATGALKAAADAAKRSRATPATGSAPDPVAAKAAKAAKPAKAPAARRRAPARQDPASPPKAPRAGRRTPS
jgi:hypothetical protein